MAKKSSYQDWFTVYHSQNQEDLVLKSFFPELKNGFYVDVGAEDADVFSVTKLFYEEGWSGINIEPQQKFYKQLQKKRPRDINLQTVLSSKRGTLTFREYPEATGLSTASNKMKAGYEEAEGSRLSGVTRKFREYDIEARTLKDVLAEHAAGKAIHFMKIDVEGFEGEVIAGNDWKKFRPKVLCIESNHIQEDWDAVLRASDYKEFMFDGINRYYIANEAYEELSVTFDYASTALSKVPISAVPLKLFLRDIANLNSNTKTLNEVLKKQDMYIRELQAEIERTQRRLSLRKIVKKASERQG